MPSDPDSIHAFGHLSNWNKGATQISLLAVYPMLAAIPFVTISLVESERSPRFAAGMHALMLKQSGRSLVDVLRVGGLWWRGFDHSYFFQPTR